MRVSHDYSIIFNVFFFKNYNNSLFYLLIILDLLRIVYLRHLLILSMSRGKYYSLVHYKVDSVIKLGLSRELYVYFRLNY